MYNANLILPAAEHRALHQHLQAVLPLWAKRPAGKLFTAPAPHYQPPRSGQVCSRHLYCTTINIFSLDLDTVAARNLCKDSLLLP